MNPNLTLECVFYSHGWSLYGLEALGLPAGREVLWVELARKSSLALMLGDPGRNHPGIAGLLDPETTLESLARRYDDLPAGLIPAASQELPLTSLAAALGVLPWRHGRIRHVLLLVNVLEASELAPVWQRASRFRIVWDLADCPDPSLAELGEILAGSGCLHADTWGGFQFHDNPRRPVPDSAHLLGEYRQLLGDYPALAMPA